MGVTQGWVSPLMKQCFVTVGVSLNMAATGLVCGYGAPLLHQLKEPHADIPIDASSGSWIGKRMVLATGDPRAGSYFAQRLSLSIQRGNAASILGTLPHVDTLDASLPGIFMFVGNLLIIPIMGKFGRRSANLISICLLIASWITIVFTTSISLLLFARAVQGTVMGMTTTFGSLLVGEYTSPRNRGAFLMTVSISISFGVFFIHMIGSYLTWRTSAMVCSVVALLDLIIVVFSPESPSWLASQGRYEECKSIFRWLRGNTEEAELKNMVEASMAVKETKSAYIEESRTLLQSMRHGCIYFKVTIRKKEFFKPLLIMIHLYVLGMWGGVNIITVYPVEFLHRTVGTEANTHLAIVSLDVQRVLTNTVAVFIIKKVRRRVMMFTTIGINIAALLAIAGHSYAKEHFCLPLDHPMIGISLAHCMLFAIAMGSLSLSFIIAGEIFPLEFKTLAGGISVLFYSLNLFLAVKTVPYFLATVGLHGMCTMIAVLICYCVAVAGYLLPETKDRTLQEIENVFRGKSSTKNVKTHASCHTTSV